MKPTPKGWPRISSALYYDPAARAIDWLCDAFGFEIRLKVEGEAGRIEHSELVAAGGLIMVGEPRRDDDGKHHRTPGEVGGANTQNLFMYVADLDAHAARARAAGAMMLSEPKVSDYGDGYWVDRGYGCVDPGGHRWWFAERVRESAGFSPRLVEADVEAPRPPRGWPRISPTLYYPDAAHAIDWLCHALGFEVQIRVDGEAGRVVHSELVFGGGLVMVSEQGDDPVRGRHQSPRALDGANTQSVMMFVDDVDAHCAHARAAGATITQPPAVSDYGEDYWADRSYGLVDVGGHHWWLTQRIRG